MNSRWYISTLIILLTLLGGVASTQQDAIPNQEIVLQFTSNDVSSTDAQNAFAIVKQQLLEAGVEEVNVLELQNGQLKISYYSHSDVESIKLVLSKNQALSIDSQSDKNQNEAPSEDKSITYNVDVYEIQQGNDVSELGGKLALESKSEHDRLVNPNVFVSADLIKDTKHCDVVSVAYKYHRTVASAINTQTRIIPEVRAGPLA